MTRAGRRVGRGIESRERARGQVPGFLVGRRRGAGRSGAVPGIPRVRGSPGGSSTAGPPDGGTSPMFVQQRYPEHFIAPMRGDLTNLGFEELRTPELVDDAVKRPGTTLLVVNSVCGCAAGKARPGIALSLRAGARPDHLTTVFAGADVEATQQARGHMAPYPPSSPSIALFKD